MKKYLFILTILLAVAESTESQDLKKSCTDLYFADLKLPKAIKFPIDLKFEVCVETVSSPARLLLRGPVTISLQDIKKNSVSLIAHINQNYSPTCENDSKHVEFESASFKPLDPPLSGLLLSLDGKVYRCAKISWYYYFTIEYSIFLNPTKTSIGLSIGEPEISRRSIGTYATDAAFLNVVGRELLKEATAVAKDLNNKIAAFETRMKNYEPRIMSPTFNASSNVIAVKFSGSFQIQANETRENLVEFFDKLSLDRSPQQ